MKRRVLEANPDRPRSRVSSRVPFGLESHLGPDRHEWLYHKTPRIETHKHYYDDNLVHSRQGRWSLAFNQREISMMIVVTFPRPDLSLVYP